MCQDEDENEDENQSFGSFWCIFNIMGDERTSTSSLLRLMTNEPYFLFVRFSYFNEKVYYENENQAVK